MAYRQPQSTVYLFKGVPCDREYQNTLYFQDKQEQWQYFRDNLNGTSFTNQYYQRYEKNKIRLQTNASTIAGTDNWYEYNYMAFCNDGSFNPLVGPSNTTQIFYCFITKIEYINENTTQISYEIDVMQTYMFEYRLGTCLVEREHTLTDYIGDNTVPEDIDIGELTVSDKWDFIFPNEQSQSDYLREYILVVFYVPNDKYIMGYNNTTEEWETNDMSINAPRGMFIEGVYQGCLYEWLGVDISDFNSRNRAKVQLDKLINTIIKTCKGEVVSISQVPTSLFYLWLLQRNPFNVTRTQINGFYNYSHNKTYVAKNKKLLSFPYQRIIVSNNIGNTGEYKWEEFYMSSAYQQSHNTMSCEFEIDGMPITATEVSCYPINYRGINKDYENCVPLNDFPMPSWSEDSFAKWWASNQNSYALGILNGVIGAGLTIAGGVAMASGFGAPAGAKLTAGGIATMSQVAGASAIAGGGASLIKTVNTAMGTYADKKNTPDQLKGQVSNTTLRVKQNRIGYTFYNTTISYENAEKIDNYFTVFGYAIKQTKVPNIEYASKSQLRPHWNYIKNVNTVILPTSTTPVRYVNEEIESKLKEIYNNGITFWMNGGEVGNYSLDNSPQ